ncbi:sulfotransferase [Halomonas sp. H10-59]|uniref:Sulfotransferase n=1 Tax=Halomonas sp. H10-59 TaxID=2950874 RepID=A0AAU7KTM8_9GAMM
MPKNDALINKGVVVIGDQDDKMPSPIIVIGTARGGTSMVAGVLAKLGVFMGDRASHPVYEDVRLSEAFEKQDMAQTGLIVKEYQTRYTRWGWKRPSIIDHLDEVDALLPNARYVFIYKDILSIAQRNSISMLAEITEGMDRALSQYRKTLRFVRQKSPRAMLVSYEKASAYPEAFLSTLESFCGISPSQEEHQTALAFIDPEPEDYIEATRITKSQGRLLSCDSRRVSGWARYVHKKQHAEVEVFVDDRSVGVVVANEPNPGGGAPANEPCGFTFTLPAGESLSEDASVRARVVNDVVDLGNSPVRVG